MSGPSFSGSIINPERPLLITEPTLSAAGTNAMRRRWWFLLPAVFVTYSLAYLDRVNYGFGAAAGLAQTLHITERQSSLLGALFFLGYFLFQVPGVVLARKTSARALIFASLFSWGLLAAATGIVRSFATLALIRFLLGVAESFIFPAMLMVLTRWFTRSERSRANSLLILGNPITVLWMSSATGYLIQAFGWQKTFVLEGMPSVIWAFIWLLLIRDEPRKARWMPTEAVAALEAKLASEETIQPRNTGLMAVFTRPDVVILAAAYFFWSLGIYGFVLWLPTIVKQGAALSMGRTGLLSSLPYVVAIPAMLIVAHRSDKTLRRRHWVWPFLLTGGLALLVSFATHSFPIAFTGLIIAGACMYAPYGPFFALVPERVPRNVAGEVLALINSTGALGGFVGAYFVGWAQAVTGGPKAGFLSMALALVCSALLMLVVGRIRPSLNSIPDMQLPHESSTVAKA